ncbi:22089_t:CDS:2, partial [Gigaspora margarita]
RLNRAAKNHCNYMYTVNTLTHENPEGNHQQRCINQNYNSMYVRENIALDYTDKRNVMNLTPDGKHRLVMQTDGNLVLYSGSTAIWASNTCGKGFGSYRMALQTDRNLVVHTGNMLPLWASNTYQEQVSYLAVQNNANVVLYDKNWNAKWARTW